MFSKPLFKQSCKANLGIWSFVTAITCFMLAALILIIGNLNVGGIRDSVVDMFVSDAIESTNQKQSMTYYNMTESALVNYESNRRSLNTLFNENMTEQQRNQVINNYDALIASGVADAEAREIICQGATPQEAASLQILIDYYLVKGNNFTQTDIDEYVLRGIENQIYGQLLETEGLETATYAKAFITQAVTDFMASGSQNPSDFATFYIPQVLKDILYSQSFDYQGRTLAVKDYFTTAELQDTSLTAILSYQAQLNVKEKQLKDQLSTENPTLSQDQIDAMVKSEMEAYKLSLIPSLSKSLLDDLPEEIADALTELGGLDISNLVIGNMFFKMAGILLPIVYIIMASNNLVASQVDSGSMAYVLSTPTKRRTVSITQMCFLILSLFAMFACTTLVGVVCLAFVDKAIVTITYGEMLLLNLGAFITMFAISGICFMCSSIFSRAKLSLSIGGGISMFFLVCTILGLFGSPIIPTAMRISAMKFFNYLSLISLFDCVSIIDGGLTFLWKLAILIVVGILTYAIALIFFKKKDLPL